LMLESLGYETTASTASREALEAVQRAPEAFDAVITDFTMPGLTGLELAQELLKIREDLPIILCTGFNEMVSEEKAKAAGIREFLMKPVSRMLFAETLQRLLSGKDQAK
jgi:CheY-like chemotaxis protein